MPRPAKTEATSDGFSTQVALEHMSSSSPNLPLQSLQPQPLAAGTVGLLHSQILGSWNPLHLGVRLHTTQSRKRGSDETTWCQRHLHSYLSLAKRLNPSAEESL
jgi:hypothetical protein